MTRMRSVCCASLIALTSASLFAQTRQFTRPGKAWRVSLASDLDAMVLADRLDTILQDARERKAALVLLELAGNRWRTDVVWAMAQVIQESQTPVVVFLQDTRDKQVGLGQLILATLCEASWIDPETRIVSTQHDNLASFAPPDTDFERVERELAGSIWLRLHERSGPILLARPLVDQCEAVWTSGWIVGEEFDVEQLARGVEPPKGADLILTITDDDSFEITLSPDEAVQLKLITAIEHRPAVVLREAGANPVSPRKVTLTSSLWQSHQRVWTLLEQLDALLIDLERLPKISASTRQRARRDIDAQLQQGLADYQRGTAQLDDLLAIYPEIPSMTQPSSHSEDFPSSRADLAKRYEKLKSR